MLVNRLSMAHPSAKEPHKAAQCTTHSHAAVVHLVDIEGGAGVGSEVALKMEHFALTATGAKAFETRLKARDEKFDRSELVEMGTVAFNVWDPDGNHIHVDFRLDE